MSWSGSAEDLREIELSMYVTEPSRLTDAAVPHARYNYGESQAEVNINVKPPKQILLANTYVEFISTHIVRNAGFY